MRIGIYAGTFDPIHKGHLAFAESAVEQAKLDRVIIVAEKEPYRKKPYASWDHRQAMIERATENIESVDHDYHFANELSHQHTMQNMLAIAKKHFGEDHEFWFLVGSDIFEHIHEWRDVVHSAEYGGFVVALKHDHTAQWLQEKLSELQTTGFGCHAILVEHSHSEASSSRVREAVKESQPLPNELPQVQEYIVAHQLYQT